MGKILTISIAAYNVEKYLEQTLHSLHDKRFIDDIEVLIIDDGSTDHTKDIALKYQNIAPNSYIYISKKNGGHGSTINKGIELASGKYFRVIDGDDWVDTDAFAKFINKLKNTDVDMVLTKHKTVCGEKETLMENVKNMDEGKVYSWSDKLDINYITLHMMTIKTELLKKQHVHITEKCFYVDIEFIIWAIYLSKSITYWELPVYLYRIGNANQSINKKNMLKNVEMQKLVSYKLISLFEQFKASGELSDVKEDVILRRITKSIGSTIRTYLLMDNVYEAKKEIMDFDKEVKKMSIYLYDCLGENKFFYFIRKNDYSYINIIRIMYKIWCIKNKNI